MDYIETKRKLDEIRKYDELMFRMAISHLMDVGIRHLDEENIKRTCEEILKEDDSKSFITNNFRINGVCLMKILSPQSISLYLNIL